MQASDQQPQVEAGDMARLAKLRDELDREIEVRICPNATLASQWAFSLAKG